MATKGWSAARRAKFEAKRRPLDTAVAQVETAIQNAINHPTDRRPRRITMQINALTIVIDLDT